MASPKKRGKINWFVRYTIKKCNFYRKFHQAEKVNGSRIAQEFIIDVVFTKISIKAQIKV